VDSEPKVETKVPRAAAGTAKDYASWAVQNEANINLAYVFVHPEPSIIFRQDNMGPPAAGPVTQSAETAPASPS
jgi:hypothetical protein